MYSESSPAPFLHFSVVITNLLNIVYISFVGPLHIRDTNSVITVPADVVVPECSTKILIPNCLQCAILSDFFNDFMNWRDLVAFHWLINSDNHEGNCQYTYMCIYVYALHSGKLNFFHLYCLIFISSCSLEKGANMTSRYLCISYMFSLIRWHYRWSSIDFALTNFSFIYQMTSLEIADEISRTITALRALTWV